jgi:hypothetical protein
MRSSEGHILISKSVGLRGETGEGAGGVVKDLERLVVLDYLAIDT